MKKAVIVAALVLVAGFAANSKATAQELRYGREVCVNESLKDEAVRLFPDATLHVIPDQFPRGMNGWRIVSGNVRPDGRIHTDEEEIYQRRLELWRNRGLWSVGSLAH